jgi:hypothetical protein
MSEQSAIDKIEKQFGIIRSANNFDLQVKQLAEKINELLNNDFQKLISILYRMDINESRLRLLLQENQHTDAGLIIAKLMIEREVQKIKSRNEFRKQNPPPDDEEKW